MNLNPPWSAVRCGPMVCIVNIGRLRKTIDSPYFAYMSVNDYTSLVPKVLIAASTSAKLILEPELHLSASHVFELE